MCSSKIKKKKRPSAVFLTIGRVVKKKILAMLRLEQIVTMGEGEKCEKKAIFLSTSVKTNTVFVLNRRPSDGRVKYKGPEEPLAAKSKVHIKPSGKRKRAHTYTQTHARKAAQQFNNKTVSAFSHKVAVLLIETSCRLCCLSRVPLSKSEAPAATAAAAVGFTFKKSSYLPRVRPGGGGQTRFTHVGCTRLRFPQLPT